MSATARPFRRSSTATALEDLAGLRPALRRRLAEAPGRCRNPRARSKTSSGAAARKSSEPRCVPIAEISAARHRPHGSRGGGLRRSRRSSSGASLPPWETRRSDSAHRPFPESLPRGEGRPKPKGRRCTRWLRRPPISSRLSRALGEHHDFLEGAGSCRGGSTTRATREILRRRVTFSSDERPGAVREFAPGGHMTLRILARRRPIAEILVGVARARADASKGSRGGGDLDRRAGRTRRRDWTSRARHELGCTATGRREGRILRVPAIQALRKARLFASRKGSRRRPFASWQRERTLPGRVRNRRRFPGSIRLDARGGCTAIEGPGKAEGLRGYGERILRPAPEERSRSDGPTAGRQDEGVSPGDACVSRGQRSSVDALDGRDVARIAGSRRGGMAAGACAHGNEGTGVADIASRATRAGRTRLRTRHQRRVWMRPTGRGARGLQRLGKGPRRNVLLLPTAERQQRDGYRCS